MKHYIKQLIQIRDELGTWQAAADELDVSRATIFNWKSGKTEPGKWMKFVISNVAERLTKSND